MKKHETDAARLGRRGQITFEFIIAIVFILMIFVYGIMLFENKNNQNVVFNHKWNAQLMADNIARTINNVYLMDDNSAYQGFFYWQDSDRTITVSDNAVLAWWNTGSFSDSPINAKVDWQATDINGYLRFEKINGVVVVSNQTTPVEHGGPVPPTPTYAYTWFASVSNSDLNHWFDYNGFVKQRESDSAWVATGELDWNVSATNVGGGGKEIDSTSSVWSKIDNLWHLNAGNSSEDFEDVVGSAEGTPVGFDGDENVAGLWGTNSFDFEGTNDCINIGSFGVGQSALTLGGWFYAEPFSTANNHGLFGKAYSFQVAIISAQSKVRFYNYTSSGAGVYASHPFPLYKWVHVVATYDGTTNKIYVDGVLSNSGPQSGTITDPYSRSFRIGCEASTGDIYLNWFDGKIEDVFFMNEALSAEEIKSVYEEQKGQWLDTNLVAYYKFNDLKSDGNISDDARSYDGNVYGGVSLDDGLWDSNALSFDGVNDYVDLGNGSGWDVFGNGEISISSWVFVDGEPSSSFPTIVNKSSGDFTNTPTNQLGIFLSVGFNASPVRNIRWALGDGTGYNTLAYTYDNSVLQNKWHHIVAVADDADAPSAQLRLYVDGALVGSTSRTYTGSIDNTMSMNFGRWGQYTRYFNGKIEELKIYNRTLTLGEIIADYNSFLNAKFVDSNIVDAGASADWNQIKVNSDLNYSFGKEICGNADSGCDADKFNNGLVGLWHLDESSGDASDATGNGNTGTWSGTTTYTNGLWDTNSASFNGSSYITAANESNFDFERTDTFSISAWVYPTDFTNGGTIVAKSQDVWCQAPGYMLLLTATGEVRIWVPNNHCAGNRMQADTDKMLELNKWAHVAITFDGSSTFSGTGIYIDGVKQENFNSVTDALTGSILTNQPLRIGRSDGAGSPFAQFKGKIDEVAVWDVELTQEEVLDLYRKGVSRLDLNVYSCSDVSCSESGRSSFLIEDVNNNTFYDISSVASSRYLGYETLFRTVSDFSDKTADFFHTGALLKDVNVVYIK